MKLAAARLGSPLAMVLEKENILSLQMLLIIEYTSNAVYLER
jgi:glucosamine 6-phosphate synthetase-like amidotransferase/phosphosugar isomerase protein